MNTQTKAIFVEQQDKSIYLSFPVDDSLVNSVVEQNSPRMCKIVDRNDLSQYNIDFLETLSFDTTGELKADINKAKEIWLKHYRRARTPLLAALDVDFMRAVESGNTDLQKEIASKKQALRDVTKTELPNTLEDIKNTWPEILGEKSF